jgi:predicted RNA-binding Zn-ribbon protein involved in translation (DUF1610 family)
MNESEKFTVKGQPLKCQHCGHDHFSHRRILLNTRGMTFFKLDWLNADADIFVCADCGHLMWFASDSVSTEEDVSQPTTCLSCSAIIPAGSTTCPKCGWTYVEA